MNKTIKVAVALTAAGVLALTGCADTSGDSASGASGRRRDHQRQRVLRHGGRQRARLRGLRGHRRGRGRHLRDVVRRVGRPEPGRRGRRGRRRRALLPRDRRDPPGGRGPGRRGLEGHPDQGHRDLLGRGLRGPQGQPREHRDLGRPGEARRRGHHAQPGLLGLRALEHPRRLGPHHRCGRQRGRRHDVPHQPARQHHRAARLGPRGDHRVHRRQRRRPALLRERGDPGQAERRRRRLRRAAGHPADPEPRHGHHRRLGGREGPSSSS